MNKYSDEMIKFVEKVLEAAEIKYDKYEITDFDVKRFYLNIDGKEYTIRNWNIFKEGIDFTLFADVKDDTGSHGEIKLEGYYNIMENKIYLEEE